jgi:tetratricopeptide (TPR) repeat protein
MVLLHVVSYVRFSIILLAYLQLVSTSTFGQQDSSFIKSLTRIRPIKSIEQEIQKATTNHEKVLGYVRLSLSSFENEAKRNYAEQALRLAKDSNDELGTGLAYMALTGEGRTRAEVDSFATAAATIFYTTGDNDLYFLTQHQAASAFFFLDANLVRSFRLFNQFLGGYSIKTDSFTFTATYNRLGEIHRILKSYDRAIDFYRLSLRMAPDLSKKTSPLINLGTIYKEKKMPDSAFYYYDKAMTLYIKENASMKPYIECRKAQVYFQLGNLPEAISWATKSLKQYDSLNNPVGIVLASGTLAEVYLAVGNYAKTILYAERCLAKSKESQYFSEQVEEACMAAATACEKTGVYQKANQFYKRYDEIRDALFGPEINQLMYQEQLQLEMVNQELENSLLQEKSARADEELSKQKVISIAISLVVIVLVYFSVNLWRRHKTITELNKELKDKSDEVLAQAEELRASNDAMEAINSNLEKLVEERSRQVLDKNQKLLEYAFFNAHKVRGPLARILGLINLMNIEPAQSEQKKYSEMLHDASKELDKSIKEINTVLDSEH